jgi:hypothetical protein
LLDWSCPGGSGRREGSLIFPRRASPFSGDAGNSGNFTAK